MKTSKHAFTTLLLMLMVYQVEAQQVIASAGNYFHNGSGSVSFTMGEPATNTFSGNGVIMTQGFQQPYNFFLTQCSASPPAGPAFPVSSILPIRISKLCWIRL